MPVPPRRNIGGRPLFRRLKTGFRKMSRANGVTAFLRLLPAAQLHQPLGLKEFQGVTKVGEVSVYPGDYVFGDMDGVVVIPQRLTEEVLVEAEKAVQRERKMRQALRKGMPLHEVNKKFGSF